MPDGLGEVIGTRLARLSPDCHRLLTIAAVIGREFALTHHPGGGRQPEETVTAALAEAVRAAVLEEESGSAACGIASHTPSSARRCTPTCPPPSDCACIRRWRGRWRRGTARTTTNTPASWPSTSPAPPTPTTSARRSPTAGAARRHATAVSAAGEAARLLEHALAIQEVVAPDDRALRCDLLTGQGQALNDAGESRRVLDEVAPEAFALGGGAGRCPSRLGGLSAGDGRPAERRVVARAEHAEAAQWAERADRWAPPGTARRASGPTPSGAPWATSASAGTTASRSSRGPWLWRAGSTTPRRCGGRPGCGSATRRRRSTPASNSGWRRSSPPGPGRASASAPSPGPLPGSAPPSSAAGSGRGPKRRGRSWQTSPPAADSRASTWTPCGVRRRWRRWTAGWRRRSPSRSGWWRTAGERVSPSMRGSWPASSTSGPCSIWDATRRRCGRHAHRHAIPRARPGLPRAGGGGARPPGRVRPGPAGVRHRAG